LNSISDRILDRELGDGADGKRDRVIGRRLREGYVHYKRYIEILNVISKHGFGYLFDRLKNITVIHKLEGAKESLKNYPRGARLRMMFEELGPTFIKIGQILSTRPDLVPEEYVIELERLKDDVTPMPFEEVVSTIEREFGAELNTIFPKFRKAPVGSASIGQVHKAITPTGKTVAVKVQRQGIVDKIKADFEILDDLAEMFGDLASISEVMDPQDIVKEFKRLITRELDYTVEARSIEHFRRDFQDVEFVTIPEVYWDLTTRKVLTMEFISGMSVDKVKKRKQAGLDPNKVALKLGEAIARMIFVNGYFHGDPHGGNILVQKSGKIALLDFGSVGYLDARMRDKIRLFYLSISTDDVSRATEIFLDICNVNESKLNRPAFEQDIREFLDFQRLQREGYQLEEGMNQRIVAVALKHGFAPPPSFILLERALLEAEGVARKLSAKFDLNQMLKPILRDVIKEKISTAVDPIGAMQTAQEYRQLMRKGPKKAYSILEKLDAGELTIKVETEFVEDLRRDLWKLFGILGVSIIAMLLLFMITVTGITLETPILNLSITAIPIVLIWLIAVWWIYRRWKGPK
jgi:ubiquinone biosynthesis protein